MEYNTYITVKTSTGTVDFPRKPGSAEPVEVKNSGKGVGIAVLGLIFNLIAFTAAATVMVLALIQYAAELPGELAGLADSYVGIFESAGMTLTLALTNLEYWGTLAVCAVLAILSLAFGISRFAVSGKWKRKGLRTKAAVILGVFDVVGFLLALIAIAEAALVLLIGTGIIA